MKSEKVVMNGNANNGSSWSPLDAQGVVLFSRAATGKFQVSLNKGDQVKILGECGGW